MLIQGVAHSPAGRGGGRSHKRPMKTRVDSWEQAREIKEYCPSFQNEQCHQRQKAVTSLVAKQSPLRANTGNDS